VAGLVLAAGCGAEQFKDSDWRDSCLTSRPAPAHSVGDYLEARVCEKVDGPDTLVLIYPNEQTREDSEDLIKGSGFGDDILATGPTWIEIPQP
jgi:hypothetical protein